MKNYDQWKNDYIRKDASRKYSSEKDLKSKYDEYINQSGESIGESMPSNKEFSSENSLFEGILSPMLSPD